METLGFGKQVKNSNSTSSIIQDRFEVRHLFLETFSSKIYSGNLLEVCEFANLSGNDMVTGKQVFIKYVIKNPCKEVSMFVDKD